METIENSCIYCKKWKLKSCMVSRRSTIIAWKNCEKFSPNFNAKGGKET